MKPRLRDRNRNLISSLNESTGCLFVKYTISLTIIYVQLLFKNVLDALNTLLNMSDILQNDVQLCFP